VRFGQRVRLVLADDHAIFRDGVRSFLEERTDHALEVVGEASSGEEAVERVLQLVPDVLLLDLGMPGLGGLGAIIELRKRGSAVRILVLTQYAEAVQMRRALEAGANGYVTKAARGEALITAVRAVAEGGTFIDPSMTALLVSGALGGGAAGPTSDEEALGRLTDRERQVLRLVAEGDSSKEIAEKLELSVKTVMAHRASIMDKLDIHNRSKLIQFGIRTGLVHVK
jgi:two-component system response regulator NreC